MTARRTGKMARSVKPLCLSNMAVMVLSILEPCESTTFDEVADQALVRIGPGQAGSPDEQRTLRRRVYDVLNVLCAADLVVRESKIIRYRPGLSERSVVSSDVEQVKARLSLKENMLVERANLLLAHRLVIERNRERQRPCSAIQLPSIFVAFTDVRNGRVRRALDGKTLEIVAHSPPLFFSPMNVFHMFRFPVERQVRCLRQMPELAELELLLFGTVPEGANQKNRQLKGNASLGTIGASDQKSVLL